MSSSQLVGSVVSLWRYPVKWMRGEELNAAEVTKFGLLGDRAYAVLDVETGKVASAKNPKKWPNLFSFRAAYIESPRVGEEIPPIRITLPDGIMVRSDDADVDATLSRALGREVALSDRKSTRLNSSHRCISYAVFCLKKKKKKHEKMHTVSE